MCQHYVGCWGKLQSLRKETDKCSDVSGAEGEAWNMETRNSAQAVCARVQKGFPGKRVSTLKPEGQA